MAQAAVHELVPLEIEWGRRLSVLHGTPQYQVGFQNFDTSGHLMGCLGFAQNKRLRPAPMQVRYSDRVRSKKAVVCRYQ